MNQQEKFQKKNDREKQVHKKVLARRERLRTIAREARKFDKESAECSPKQEPYRKPSKKDAELLKQMQHNLELLKGLEEEYQKSL